MIFIKKHLIIYLILLFSSKLYALELVYNFYAPTEGIYKVKNPFNVSQTDKIVITSAKLNYQPYYDSKHNEFYVYTSEASNYQLRINNGPKLQLAISPIHTFKKKKFYKYSLPDNFIDDHWFHDIIPADNRYIDTLIIDSPLDTLSDSLKLTIFPFSAGKNSILVKINGKENNFSLYGLTDQELPISYPTNPDRSVIVEIYSPFSTIGVRGYSIDNINRRINYTDKFQRYNYQGISNYPGPLNDQYDYFTVENGSLQLIHSTAKITTEHFSNLLVHEQNSYKTLRLMLAEFPSKIDSANYLILYHNKFHALVPAIEKLIEQINPNKFITKAVNVQKVYNQYSFGEKSPEAIKAYLHSNNLSFVLLVGDANITEHPENDLIPIFYHIQDHKGTRVETDYMYTYKEIPTNPQFSIGRIPVSSQQELSDYIHKLQNYLAQNKNMQTLIYDDVNLLDGKHLSKIENVIYTNPDHNFFTKLLEAPLIEYINEYKPTEVIYAGHAAYSGWSNQNKIEIDAFEEAKDSIIFQIIDLSCWTGTFANNTEDCFAEELLKLSNKGAITTVASSGYSLIGSYTHIINYILSHRNVPLGELINQIKVELFKKNQIGIDDMHAMNILGLPSLPFR